MFYEYLKNSFEIITNYGKSNYNMKSLIVANTKIIDSLKNNNLYAPDKNIRGGGVPENQERIATELIKKIHELKQKMQKSDFLSKDEFDRLSTIINYFVKYIVLLQQIIDDIDLETLKSQLHEINEILEKHVDSDVKTISE